MKSGPILIQVGPSGGYCNGCSSWNEPGYTCIKQIFIGHEDYINSIQVAYYHGEDIILFDRHGGTANKFDIVNMRESEQLLEVSGYYGPFPDNQFEPNAIRSLKFTTTLKTYGPFGYERGTPFSFKIGPDEFGGFHGRSNSLCLYAIGIYVKTLATIYGGKDEVPRLTN